MTPNPRALLARRMRAASVSEARMSETGAYGRRLGDLDGDTSVMVLARACGQSTKHFSRAFCQSIGLPPHQWLLQRRVDKAKQLLRDSRSPLADVAVDCGFADQSHFTRVFTRAVGISPGQWRRARDG
jgi:AraC-like DNA-binding protein